MSHGPVEVDGACPYVGARCVGHVGLGEAEDAVALLDEARVSREASSVNGAGVSVTDDAGVVGGALHPAGDVEGGYVGRCVVADGDVGVVGLADDYVLAVVGGADGGAVSDLGAPRHREGWGSDGDALQLACKVAHVGRLVVSDALPYHGVAVLVVVPEGVDAVLGGDGGGVDA